MSTVCRPGRAAELPASAARRPRRAVRDAPCARRARSSPARPSPPSSPTSRPGRPAIPATPEHTPGGSTQRLGRGGGRRALRPGARHPDDRLDRPAGRLLRRRRLQAELRADLARRRDPARALARPRRSVRARSRDDLARRRRSSSRAGSRPRHRARRAAAGRPDRALPRRAIARGSGAFRAPPRPSQRARSRDRRDRGDGATLPLSRIATAPSWPSNPRRCTPTGTRASVSSTRRRPPSSFERGRTVVG